MNNLADFAYGQYSIRSEISVYYSLIHAVALLKFPVDETSLPFKFCFALTLIIQYETLIAARVEYQPGSICTMNPLALQWRKPYACI